MSKDDSSSKEPVKKEISDLKDKAKKIKEQGRNLTEFGQSLEDLADATWGYIESVDNTPSFAKVIGDFKLLNEQTGIVLAQSSMMDYGSVYSTTATASLSVINDLHPNLILPLNEASKHETIITKYHEIEEVTERNANEAEIIELFKEFGFDKAPSGRKSILEHFNIAQSAFKNPVTDENPVSTSLIPMRECIRAMIDTLLKYRPQQEKTRKEEDKITSIGQQLKKDTIPEDLIISLADKWRIILGEDLSSAKEININRLEWKHRLTKSMLFIKSLLTALDVQKFK